MGLKWVGPWSEGDIHSALRELPSEVRSQPCSHGGPELGGGGKGLEEAYVWERREERTELGQRDRKGGILSGAGPGRVGAPMRGLESD